MALVMRKWHKNQKMNFESKGICLAKIEIVLELMVHFGLFKVKEI